MICCKSYQDIPNPPEYNEPDKEDIWEKWIESYEETNGKADKETEDILWEFFVKIVYKDYDFENNCNCSDWSLQEIKDRMLNWYITNYDKAIEQLGHLIRDVQRNNLINKQERSEALKQSQLLYTKLTGSCI